MCNTGSISGHITWAFLGCLLTCATGSTFENLAMNCHGHLWIFNTGLMSEHVTLAFFGHLWTCNTGSALERLVRNVSDVYGHSG